MQPPFHTLKKRAEFLQAAAKGKKAVARTLLLQAIPLEILASKRIPLPQEEDRLHIGFTTSKKLGNAVARNRIRRRLRAAAAQVLPLHADRGHAYVLIGRPSSLECGFDQMTGDLLWALRKTASLRGA